MVTTKTRTETVKKPAPKARRKTKAVACPHCGAEVAVYRNGKKMCHECGKTFSVKGSGPPGGRALPPRPAIAS